MTPMAAEAIHITVNTDDTIIITVLSEVKYILLNISFQWLKLLYLSTNIVLPSVINVYTLQII